MQGDAVLFRIGLQSIACRILCCEGVGYIAFFKEAARILQCVKAFRNLVSVVVVLGGSFAFSTCPFFFYFSFYFYFFFFLG
jgi:hypothetical protein